METNDLQLQLAAAEAANFLHELVSADILIDEPSEEAAAIAKRIDQALMRTTLAR